MWVQGCGCARVEVYVGVGVHLLGLMGSGCAPFEDGDCNVGSSLVNPGGDAGVLLSGLGVRVQPQEWLQRQGQSEMEFVLGRDEIISGQGVRHVSIVISAAVHLNYVRYETQGTAALNIKNGSKAALNLRSVRARSSGLTPIPDRGPPFRHSRRAICTVLLDPRDPLLHSERTQGFAADPDYGRAKRLPMLGEIKT